MSRANNQDLQRGRRHAPGIRPLWHPHSTDSLPQHSAEVQHKTLRACQVICLFLSNSNRNTFASMWEKSSWSCNPVHQMIKAITLRCGVFAWKSWQWTLNSLTELSLNNCGNCLHLYLSKLVIFLGKNCQIHISSIYAKMETHKRKPPLSGITLYYLQFLV